MKNMFNWLLTVVLIFVLYCVFLPPVAWSQTPVSVDSTAWLVKTQNKKGAGEFTDYLFPEE